MTDGPTAPGPAPLPVALVGAFGRMGRLTDGLLATRPEFEVVARVGRGDDLATALEGSGARLAVDFTEAGLGARHARVLLELGVRPLVGTSGVAPEEDAPLDALARERGLGGLVVPNFCLGVWLQQRLAKEAAHFLTSVEVVEEHHAAKKDAPSGTALDTARQLEGVLGRAPGGVPVHALRLEGLYSNQSVVFGGPGEVLRLTHQTFGLEAFAPGILAGLSYVARAEGVARGIGHAFEWAARRNAEARAGGAPPAGA